MSRQNINEQNRLIQQMSSSLEISSERRNFGFVSSYGSDQDSGNIKIAVSPSTEALQKKFLQLDDTANTLTEINSDDKRVSKAPIDETDLSDDIDVQLVKPKKKPGNEDDTSNEVERALIISKKSGIVGGEG